MTPDKHASLRGNAPEEGALTPWFEAARADPPAPSSALMARILADAAAATPRPEAKPAAPARAGWLRWLGAVLAPGNALPTPAPLAAGLATALVLGMGLGFSLAPDAAARGVPGLGVAEAEAGAEDIMLSDLERALGALLAEG